MVSGYDCSNGVVPHGKVGGGPKKGIIQTLWGHSTGDPKPVDSVPWGQQGWQECR